MRMKYALFMTYDMKERDEVVERAAWITKDKDKNPDKYPTWLINPMGMGGLSKTLLVVEATEKQLMNIRHAWMPYCSLECVPLFDAMQTTQDYPKLMK